MQNIYSYAQTAKSNLDAAFALTPERDMAEMKEEALAAAIPSSTDKETWLQLASLSPDELITVSTGVYAEIYGNGEAIINAALDEEANILLNP